MPHLPSSYGAEGTKAEDRKWEKEIPTERYIRKPTWRRRRHLLFPLCVRPTCVSVSLSFYRPFFLAVLLFARIIWDTLLYLLLLLLLLLPFSRPPPPPPLSHEDADSPGCTRAIRPIPYPSVNNETLRVVSVRSHPRQKSDISGRREREEEESIRGDEKKKEEKE